MTTALIYTSPARGHLYPIMDTAIELKQRGYKVIVQTLSSEEQHIRDAGFEFRSINSQIESLQLRDYDGNTPLGQFRLALSCWLKRAPYEIEDLKQSIALYNPDILVTDANTWGASSYAQATNLPWTMFMPFCLPLPSPDVPAFGPGFAPPKTSFGRLRDRLVRGLTRLAIKQYIDEFNKLRASIGAPGLKNYEELFLQPSKLLYLTSEPFEYPRQDWPKNVVSLGPGLWAPKSNTPSWIEAMPRPRILVSVSTEYQNDGAIITNTLEALRDEPVSIIVTSSALKPEDYQTSVSNVRIEKFIPHDRLIPHVDLVVTHGGMGSTQRALANGVPVCAVPWGRDQNETARRVELSGSGTRLPRAKLSPRALLNAVRKALKCKVGAENVATGYQQGGGAARAASIIESLIAPKPNSDFNSAGKTSASAGSLEPSC